MNLSKLSSADRPIDHVGVAVHSIEESKGLFERITGEECSPPETLEAQGVRVAFVGMVELLQPLSPETTVGRFLERRGQAMHHVAFRTDDIVGELARLESAGVQLIDRVPRRGARGHSVAFLHPSHTGGVLTELVMHPASDRFPPS